MPKCSLFIKKYHVSIVIRADRETVWKTLTDLSRYCEWNSFTPEIQTNWHIGESVRLSVAMKKNRKPIIQREYLQLFIPNESLAWGMDWGPLLMARRVQTLTSTGLGTTEYFTEDVISGWLCPVVHALYGKKIQEGFERMAAELKHYMEKS